MLLCNFLLGQSNSQNQLYFTTEFLIGKTMEANTGFPKSNLQTSLFVSLSRDNNSSETQWSRILGYPKTGVTLGVTDFGNTKEIGKAYSILPFIEFDLFKKKSNKWHLLTGLGGSYIDTQYHITNNPHNHAISTKLNWAFKSFIYYDAFSKKQTNWRVGLGYLHNSNGHSRLPNQGLNSFLLSLSSQFNLRKESTIQKPTKEEVKFNRTTQNYFSFRSGIGVNVLSQVFNDKKEVYSVAISTGKIINNTFKFGGGVYYRFYEKYYDYIKNDGELMLEQEPHYKDNPFLYASNFGVFGTAELLLNHVGIEFDLGFNIFKPSYRFDWQLSQGYVYTSMATGEPQPAVVLEELNTYYEIKRSISSRLGIKYYILNTSKAPKHNFFIGAHINANLGQADFSELSLGYVYQFSRKKH